MKLRIIFIVLCFSCFSCSSQTSQNIQVTFYAEDRGGVGLHVIIDPNNTGILCEPEKEIIILKTPSETINPWTFFEGGNFYVATDDKNHMVYGSYQFVEVISDGVERIIAAFKRKGPSEKWIGSAAGDGNIFTINENGESILIGQYQFMEIKIPGEEKDTFSERTVTATRMANQNSAWITCLGDKIFKIQEDGNITQIGWFGWRKIKTPGGSTLVILMTKGIEDNSKWAGQYNGRIYQDSE
jgi:hypothetical protein